jgi:hypothetical protein
LSRAKEKKKKVGSTAREQEREREKARKGERGGGSVNSDEMVRWV